MFNLHIFVSILNIFLELISNLIPLCLKHIYLLHFLVAQTLKNLPEMWEYGVQSLSWEDPLEEGIVSHFSILAWRIPMDGGAWWAMVHGVAKSRARLSD